MSVSGQRQRSEFFGIHDHWISNKITARNHWRVCPAFHAMRVISPKRKFKLNKTHAGGGGEMTDEYDGTALDQSCPPLLNMDAADVLDAVMRAKDGAPNQFQSFWEMDEEGVDEATNEEIENSPQIRILWAAENNHMVVVETMLDGDPDLIQARDSDDYTPLHRACYNGHVDVVKLLLSRNADIHARTIDGWQPLHSAARWNQAEVVVILLQNGACINAQTNGGLTALHVASSERDSRATLEILLTNCNIDVGIRNSIGETAHEICRRTSEHCSLFEITESHINMIE